jgi:hypothetical protein
VLVCQYQHSFNSDTNTFASFLCRSLSQLNSCAKATISEGHDPTFSKVPRKSFPGTSLSLSLLVFIDFLLNKVEIDRKNCKVDVAWEEKAYKIHLETNLIRNSPSTSSQAFAILLLGAS